ncbi:hypothetical protein ABGB18_07710 [Nonomuraea sp. B12E4]|uniref:hypothetical protein n=1 Tax=Nonomuraea sp. B12E4 TaxID=3153564 RepID=UPI00325EB950
MTTTTWIPAAGPAPGGADAGIGVWLAVALIALFTLGGAWLARRTAARLTMWLTVSSAVMLVTVLTDLLPGAWQGAAGHGIPQWLVGASAAAGFLAIAVFTRDGGAPGHVPPAGAGRHAPGLHRRAAGAAGAAWFGGVGTAVALVVHRAIEGATLALAASVVVVVALAVHSASEGLAVAAMLGMARRRLWPWLAISCAGPALGVVIATVRPIPAHAVPILLGAVAGVLSRTALVGLRLAVGRGAGRLPRRHLVVAGMVAAMVAGGLGTVQWVGAVPVALEDPAHPGPRPSRPFPLSPDLDTHARTGPTPSPGASHGLFLRGGAAPPWPHAHTEPTPSYGPFAGSGPVPAPTGRKRAHLQRREERDR